MDAWLAGAGNGIVEGRNLFGVSGVASEYAALVT
jgi:hypothetical protein